MPKYKLLGGEHVHTDYKIYGKGDVLETDLDLISMFKNKFVKVENVVRVTNAPTIPTQLETLKKEGKLIKNKKG